MHQASVKIGMHKRHCVLFVYILTALLLFSIEFEVIGNNPMHRADDLLLAEVTLYYCCCCKLLLVFSS